MDSLKDLHAALRGLGAPLLLKTRRGGYDGKGQAWAMRPEEAETALAAIGQRGAVAEVPADFRRELAMIAARGATARSPSIP